MRHKKRSERERSRSRRKIIKTRRIEEEKPHLYKKK